MAQRDVELGGASRETASGMNEISRKHAHTQTVTGELASARQHQKNWPIFMERAMEGK